MGWKSTINPMNSREGSGFLGNTPLKFNMEHLKFNPLSLNEIPALETIIFRFHVKFWQGNKQPIWRSNHLIYSGIPPQKLTWQWKNTIVNREIHLQMVVFPCHISFPECISFKKQPDETNIMFKHLQMTCQNKKQGGIHHKPCKPFEPWKNFITFHYWLTIIPI